MSARTKKLGVLTYFWANNPGTVLQAYSMLQVLQQKLPGWRIELIDCKHSRGWFHFAKRDVDPCYLISDYRRHRIYKEFRRNCLAMSAEAILTDDYDTAARFVEKQRYDAIVVGADTVLQMLPGYLRRNQPPIYWLPPMLECKKFTISASSSALTYESLDPGMRSRLAESINRFDLVGVRDDLTYELMTRLGLSEGSKLERTPDPTFMVDVDPSHIEHRAAQEGIDLSRPSIGICIHGDLGAQIAAHFKSKGYQIIDIYAGERRKYGDWRPIAISPFEWAGLYKYVRLAITDRFHGTVFSLKNATPVVAIDLDSRSHMHQGPKTYSILKEFGLNETNYIKADAVAGVEAMTAKIEAAISVFDRRAVSEKIRQLQRRFDSFLDRVVQVLQ